MILIFFTLKKLIKSVGSKFFHLEKWYQWSQIHDISTYVYVYWVAIIMIDNFYYLCVLTCVYCVMRTHKHKCVFSVETVRHWVRIHDFLDGHPSSNCASAKTEVWWCYELSSPILSASLPPGHDLNKAIQKVSTYLTHNRRTDSCRWGLSDNGILGSNQKQSNVSVFNYVHIEKIASLTKTYLKVIGFSL